MGAQRGAEEPGRGSAGRHRRAGKALIQRRDHAPERAARPRSLPAPSPSALVGIAVLVLIGAGAVHLSGSGSAVPLEEAPSAAVEVAVDDSGESDREPAAGGGTDPTTDGGEDGGEDDGADGSGAGAGHGASIPPDPSAAPEALPPGTPSGEAEQLVVHVSGAVSSPGVVRLPAGSRVDDALRAAGGATKEADLSAVNLARPLEDGEQIHVPVPGEEPPPAAPDAAAPGSADGPSAAESGDPEDGAPIDLNTASASELEELPGVGPAIARRIVEHRENNGPFTSVDGLLEVSGIGPATLEKIRDRATV